MYGWIGSVVPFTPTCGEKLVEFHKFKWFSFDLIQQICNPFFYFMEFVYFTRYTLNIKA